MDYIALSLKLQSISRTIKNLLLRLSLQLENCRVQCYDGAGTMAGWKTDVATTLLWKEARPLSTHCYSHALNLAVRECVKANHILHDTLNTIKEMTKLIKKSSKCESIFHKVESITCDSPGYAPPGGLFMRLLFHI